MSLFKRVNNELVLTKTEEELKKIFPVIEADGVDEEVTASITSIKKFLELQDCEIQTHTDKEVSYSTPNALNGMVELKGGRILEWLDGELVGTYEEPTEFESAWS